MYIISLFCAFTASSAFQRLTADWRKQGGEQRFRAGRQAAARLLEAHPRSEEGKQVSLTVADPLLLKQPPKYYTAYVEKGN